MERVTANLSRFIKQQNKQNKKSSSPSQNGGLHNHNSNGSTVDSSSSSSRRIAKQVAVHRAKFEEYNKTRDLSNEKLIWLMSVKWYKKWVDIEKNGPPSTKNRDWMIVDNSDLIDPNANTNYDNNENKNNETKGNENENKNTNENETKGNNDTETKADDDSEEKENKNNDIETNDDKVLTVQNMMVSSLRPGLKYGRDFIYMNRSTAEFLCNKLRYQLRPEIQCYVLKTLNPATQVYTYDIELYRTTFYVHYQKFHGPKKMVTIKASLQEPVRRLEFCIASYLVCQASFIRLRHGSPDGPIWDESNQLEQLDVMSSSMFFSVLSCVFPGSFLFFSFLFLFYVLFDFYFYFYCFVF